MNHRLVIARGLAAACCAAAASASAALADLSTWNAFGDVSAAPTGAVLTTAFADEAPRSGTGALDYMAFEPALGLAYDALGGDTWDGSALQRRFTTTAGSLVRVTWSLATDVFDAAYADRAYAVIDGVPFVLATVAADPVTGSFSHLFDTGDHALAFGVADAGDVLGVSTLTLSNFAFVATGEFVPEPGTWVLLLAGVAGLAVRLRG